MGELYEANRHNCICILERAPLQPQTSLCGKKKEKVMLKTGGKTSKGIPQDAEQDRTLAWDKEVTKGWNKKKWMDFTGI